MRQKFLMRHLLAWALGALVLVWASFVVMGFKTGVHEADELTDGHLASVQKAAEAVVASAPGMVVTSLDQASHLIGSSLTAVDLGGLTRAGIRLGYGFRRLLAVPIVRL